MEANVGEAAMVSSKLVLTEVPRAVRRAARLDLDLPLDLLLERAGEALDTTAADLYPIDAFVSHLRRAPGRRRPPRRPAHDGPRHLTTIGSCWGHGWRSRMAADRAPRTDPRRS